MKNKGKYSAIFIGFIAVTILFGSSCLNDKEPSPSFDCTTSTVTYTANIKSILDNNCVSCHKAGGTASPQLEDYTKAKNNIERILVRMQSSSSPMPPSGLLNQNNIDLVKCWNTKGLVE